MIFASLTKNMAAVVRNLLIALAFVIAVPPAHANTAAAPVSESEARNEAIVREAFEGWAAGSASVFDLLSPDIRWTIPGSGPVADTYHGVDDFMQRASAPLVSRLASPLTPEVHHIWAVGDRVIIRFDASATTTSGAQYRNQFLWIFRMEDGSVVDNNEPRQQ